MEEALAKAVPWDPDAPLKELMVFKADTFTPHKVFDVKDNAVRFARDSIAEDPEKYVALGPNLRYYHQVLPRGELVEVYSSRVRGWCAFDGPVTIPVLFQKKDDSWFDLRDRKPNVWMSYTPMEVFTLRGGTRLAKGHTVIAGLGLGYQLMQVLRRPKVTKVTLVEKEKDLKPVLSAVQKLVTPDEWKKLCHIIFDDAYKIVPVLEADVALIDIFEGYGGKEFVSCPKIDKVWCWGAPYAPGGQSIWSSMHVKMPW